MRSSVNYVAIDNHVWWITHADMWWCVRDVSNST